VHLFASDKARFPYHQNAPYQPPAAPLEDYVSFAREAGLTHAVIVHPEPYQDDHRYLEYCLTRGPSPAFFKGTCLFDPLAPGTPARMDALVKANPNRIVALRIHQVRKPGEPPLKTGPIKERDMRDPAMRSTWAKAGELGLAIQMHFNPHFAGPIGELAERFPQVPVVLDHLARAGQGSAEDFAGVLRLARFPRVHMKLSGVNYSSQQPFPHKDAKPYVKRAFDAFGPQRMIWGGLGMDMQAYRSQTQLFEEMLDFASAADRARIRGQNAVKLYGW
jgi:predicted TIM-barrel fold metal-dependent hydrolase